MHFAVSGGEALDWLSGEIEPRMLAVLSDINMPGMDRLELLGQIRQRFPDCPYDGNCMGMNDERRRHADKHGAAEFITKPVVRAVKDQLRQLPS